MKTIRQKNLQWLFLSVIIIILDQLSKHWVLAHVENPIHVFSWFNIVLTYNRGSAFGFLNTASSVWQVWMFGVIALVVSGVIIALLVRAKIYDRWMAISLSLILGGALGNVMDRIFLGKVVDFIDWHALGYHWPAFNIADSAVCVGAVLMFLLQIFGTKKNDKQ